MNRIRSKSTILLRRFYEKSPEVVARALLGKTLVHDRRGQRITGRIIETEAYLGLSDPASHALTGLSSYNAFLFGPAGRTDVHLIYGLHHCLNVSCLPDGEAGGILIRALDPIEGVATMAALRGLQEIASVRSLTGSPGRLCQTLGITRATHHGIDVMDPALILQIVDDGYCPKEIEAIARIGIRKAADQLLRFLARDETTKIRDR